MKLLGTTACFDFPLKTWWKARKYFRLPDIKITVLTKKTFDNVFHWDENCLIEIQSIDVCWKSKYDSPRHERNPLFLISFCGIFGIYIEFVKNYRNCECKVCDGSMEYYEYMLDYLYFTKSLKYDNYWEFYSKIIGRSVIIPTPMFSLNKNGYKKFIEEYKVE